MRYFILFIFIALSIGVFTTVIKPRYDALQALKSDVSVSDASLATASKLKASREELITRYNSIPKADLDNIKTLLPDSVDNIRLIIQIDSLATKNGLSTLRNVDYQSGDDKKTAAPSSIVPSVQPAKTPYGEFLISFQTVGQYKNFLAFLSDLEQNLRLVDVTGVEFSTNEANPGLTTNMMYTVTLKTYWLKQ